MSWDQFLGILREAKDIAEKEASKPPVACPNDGEPLLDVGNGVLFCRFDGWQYP